MSFVKNQIDPTAIFVQKPDKGDALIVKEVVVTLLAATANQTIVAAVAGKSIVVLEGIIYSSGAAIPVGFKNGSGGGFIKNYYIPANTVANPNIQLPPVPWGLMRTSSGVGLFADTGGANTVVVSLSYIEVTP